MSGLWAVCLRLPLPGFTCLIIHLQTLEASTFGNIINHITYNKKSSLSGYVVSPKNLTLCVSKTLKIDQGVTLVWVGLGWVGCFVSKT